METKCASKSYNDRTIFVTIKQQMQFSLQYKYHSVSIN